VNIWTPAFAGVDTGGLHFVNPPYKAISWQGRLPACPHRQGCLCYQVIKTHLMLLPIHYVHRGSSTLKKGENKIYHGLFLVCQDDFVALFGIDNISGVQA